MITTDSTAYSVKRTPGEPPRPARGLPAAVPKAATDDWRGPSAIRGRSVPVRARPSVRECAHRRARRPPSPGQQLIYLPQRRAAAGEHDAALGDVGAELGRGLLERLLDGADDRLQRLLQRLEDLVAVEREAARHALGEIASLDRQLAHLLAGIGGADLDLDALGGRLADQDAVVAAHVVRDRLVEAIAADARGAGVHNHVERKH